MVSHNPQGRGDASINILQDYNFFSRVTVHSTKTLPLVDEEGFDVETNRATSIAFHSINYERQKQPYGICISSWNETDIGGIVTSEHGELPYTQGVRINNKLSLSPPAMHEVLFLQSFCEILWLLPPPAARSKAGI